MFLKTLRPSSTAITAIKASIITGLPGFTGVGSTTGLGSDTGCGRDATGRVGVETGGITAGIGSGLGRIDLAAGFFFAMFSVS